MINLKMTPAQRAEFRNAIVSHPGWKAYRQARGLNSASMTLSQWATVALELGVPAPSRAPAAPLTLKKRIAKALHRLAYRIER